MKIMNLDLMMKLDRNKRLNKHLFFVFSHEVRMNNKLEIFYKLYNGIKLIV